MNKLSISVFTILLILVTACSELTDDQRVSMLIRDAANNSKQAEEAYNNALASIQSFAAGKPLYLIAEEVKEQNKRLKTSIILLADIAVNRSKDIKNEKVKKALSAGVSGLYNAYNIKHNFLSDAAIAINSGSESAILAVNSKHSEQIAKIDLIHLMAFSELTSAKTLVDLPRDLNEFK